MTNQKRGLLINNSFMGLHGVAQVMIGTTLPEMIRSFNLSLAQGGLIVSIQAAGGLLIMFAGMLLADRVRKPTWILGSVALAGVSLGLLGFAAAYWFVLVVFFTMGVIVQLMDSLLNAFTGEIAPGTRTRHLNLLHMLYGIGAFVGPTFARWLLNQSLTWNNVYWLVGGLYLAVAALSLIWSKSYLALEPHPVGRVSASAESGQADAGPGTAPVGGWMTVVVIGLLIAFYAVHQLGTTSWLPLYLESVLGMGASAASVSLSLYWVGIILSRFLASVFGSRLGEFRILIWGSLIAGLALIGVVVVGSPGLAIVGFLLAGILTGATIPLGMAIAYGCVPGRTGSVTSVVYGLMMVGRLVGPWIMGRVGDRFGLGNGIMIAAIVLLVVGLAAVIAERRHRALES